MTDPKQITVIIAEDEPVILHNIAKKVENTDGGFRVIRKAANGLEVLALLERQIPDILITDIEMPGMNGLQLIGEVTARYPSVRIVILSGYHNFEYARTAMRYGVKEYLLKPVVQSDLSTVLLKLAAQILQDKKNQERNILSKAISHVGEEAASPACFQGKSFLLSLITLGNLPAMCSPATAQSFPPSGRGSILMPVSMICPASATSGSSMKPAASKNF